MMIRKHFCYLFSVKILTMIVSLFLLVLPYGELYSDIPFFVYMKDIFYKLFNMIPVSFQGAVT